MSGVAVIVPEFVPLAGDRPSQLALSEAVQLMLPPPVLLTDSVLAAGFGPPAVPLNDRLVGLTDSDGAEKAPLGELVDIMDVGFTCAYLSTFLAKRITGGTVYVDGGTNIIA